MDSIVALLALVVACLIGAATTAPSPAWFWVCVALALVFAGGALQQVIHARHEREATHQKAVREQESARQNRILYRLRQEFCDADGITMAMVQGRVPLPKEWTESRLATIGETWRRDVYW